MTTPLGEQPEERRTAHQGPRLAYRAATARAEALQGIPDAAISVADRALTLADELTFERPPRALGYRGSARADIGDAAGIEDMREAIRLATNAGQGREVALLHKAPRQPSPRSTPASHMRTPAE